MTALEVVTDPAWNSAVQLLGLVVVVMIVVAGLQELALHLLGRGDRS